MNTYVVHTQILRCKIRFSTYVRPSVFQTEVEKNCLGGVQASGSSEILGSSISHPACVVPSVTLRGRGPPFV